MKKVSEAHFQKVLKRQKSANSTKKCSNDNLKSAQTTIFIKLCISAEKSFCNILGAEWHLLPLEKANLHKNLGFLCQSNKKQDHLPLFRLIRTLGTQFFVIFRSPVINL